MPRDLRDPQKLGESLLKQKASMDQPGATYALSELYDDYEHDVPDYDHGESLSVFTKREYRAELQEAAERGDRHAADTLKGIPNDDPAGE